MTNTLAFALPVLRNQGIPLRLRKKLGKMMGTPRAGIDFKVRLFESWFEGRTGNHQDDKIYTYGSHEAATLRLMRTILDRQTQAGQNTVYIDIGTNIGQHLVAVADKASKAYGFEPWDAVRDRAVSNLSLNNFQHVRVMGFGLSDQDAKIPYYPPAGDNLGVGTFVADSQTTQSIVLEVRHGDTVMAEHGIKPTLVKIDTEGFEAFVLKGLKQTLETHRPAVVFELSDESRKDLGSYDALAAHFPKGYTFYGILRSREMPRLVPFSAGRKFENLLAWPDDTAPL